MACYANQHQSRSRSDGEQYQCSAHSTRTRRGVYLQRPLHGPRALIGWGCRVNYDITGIPTATFILASIVIWWAVARRKSPSRGWVVENEGSGRYLSILNGRTQWANFEDAKVFIDEDEAVAACCDGLHLNFAVPVQRNADGNYDRIYDQPGTPPPVCRGNCKCKVSP